MYITSEEQTAISLATHNAKRNFRYYQYASWFTGWDTPIMQDAALRCHIVDNMRSGDKPRDEYFTALAKFHYMLDRSERYIVFSDIPNRQIGGSIARMMRIYRERYYDYAGTWVNMENEIVLAALALAPRTCAALPPSVFTQFVNNVRLQLSKEMAGTCGCGLRASYDMCVICGTGAKT